MSEELIQQRRWMIPGGVLGDRVGRKRVLVGLVAFGISSVLSAYSQTPDQLIIARALMGISGAAVLPSTLSIISKRLSAPRAGQGDRHLGRRGWTGAGDRGRLPAGSSPPILVGIGLPARHRDRPIRPALRHQLRGKRCHCVRRGGFGQRRSDADHHRVDGRAVGDRPRRRRPSLGVGPRLKHAGRVPHHRPRVRAAVEYDHRRRHPARLSSRSRARRRRQPPRREPLRPVGAAVRRDGSIRERRPPLRHLGQLGPAWPAPGR